MNEYNDMQNLGQFLGALFVKLGDILDVQGAYTDRQTELNDEQDNGSGSTSN